MSAVMLFENKGDSAGRLVLRIVQDSWHFGDLEWRMARRRRLTKCPNRDWEAHAVLAVGVTIGSGDPCTLIWIGSTGDSRL